jgi:ubiquinone/menaquinone biosynthesis C-methylase UbiE
MAMPYEPTHNRYDPEQFWNAKARASAGDYEKAVCLDDPLTNRCIDNVQRSLIDAAMRQIRHRTSLSGKAVLDYGCGSGRWVRFFTSYGCAYTGVDISSEMLALAAHRYPAFQFRKVENGVIPCPDTNFDIVTSIAVVHHNPYDQQGAILKELARVLRNGGYLILFEALGDKHVSDDVHFPRDEGSWGDLAKLHGLSLLWRRAGRYRIIHSFLSRYTQRQSFRLIDHLDVFLDPHLGRLLTARHQERSAMLFQKTG